MEEKSKATHKTYSSSYFQVKSSLCHTQTFPVLIQALFKQLLYFRVPAKTQVIVEDLQGTFTFFSMESFWNEVHKPNNCGTGQTFANYRSGWWFFYYKFCNFCTWKLTDNLLFWTTFLLIVFSRSGWSGGQGDQNGQGGQSCRNIRWSGWLGWSEWSGWLPLPPYICQQETSPKWTDLKERESTFAKNSLLKQHWVIHELHNFQPSKHLLVFCRQDKEISWQGSGENFLQSEGSIFNEKLQICSRV